jgi:serralysin
MPNSDLSLADTASGVYADIVKARSKFGGATLRKLSDSLDSDSLSDATTAAGQPVVSLQTLADYLYSGYYGLNLHWGSNTVTYDVSALTNEEANLARNAFAAWARVCNLTFVEQVGGANITLNHNGTGAATSMSWYSSGALASATVSIAASWMTTYYSATFGDSTLPYYNYAYQTYLHEIGHALGLGHQGPYNGSATYGTSNIYANDSWQFSIMSYMGQDNYNYGGLGCSYMWISGPMQADIRAMQMKYGAPAATTVRRYGYQADTPSFDFGTGGRSFCMYAPDGWVQLDGRGYAGAQTVDMRAGAFSSLRGYANNISTYTNTRIRDYWCGSGGDTVYFSSGGVNVYGGAGADSFYDYGAGGGLNAVSGGGGVDRVVINASGANFSFRHTAQSTTGWSVTASGYNDALTGVETIQFSDRTITLRQARSNFNFGATNDAGATSDLLLFNGANVVTWTMLNGAWNAGAFVGAAAGWSVVGTGDFNGDGTADVLLKNNTTGDIVDWMMQNGGYSSGSFVGNANGWSVVGTGDFDNNGTLDILLKDNATGQVVDWMMQNGAFSAGHSIGAASGWSVVGTGDFNGDGTSDILLQNAAGDIVEWLMQNGLYSSGRSIGNASGWSVVGTGDFNGDGTTDILLKNNANGAVVDWLMQNGSFSSGRSVGGASGWSIVGTGDYNGDGTSDIALSNGSNVVYWAMRNGSYLSGGSVGGLGGYSVVG